MVASRRWPVPPDAAIHLIGDTHFGAISMTQNRRDLWAADIDRAGLVPESLVHIVAGDFTDAPGAHPEQDPLAIGYMNDHYGPGTWLSAVGNHDMYGRGPDEAATAWGMPASNFVHDMPGGLARLIFISPDGIDIAGDGYTMDPFTTERLDWLNDQLDTDLPCLITCHWALADTVGPTSISTISSYSPGYHVDIDADVRAVLADNPSAKAWLSGHTHSPVESPDLVKPVQVGGHTLAAINGSAPCYNGDNGDNLYSDQYTLFLTLTDGQIDVRFRNHGAGIWHVAGPDRRQVWSVAL